MIYADFREHVLQICTTAGRRSIIVIPTAGSIERDELAGLFI
jgi:hypothetical protein